MYPQLIEVKTLGRFEIDPEEVREHYIKRGTMNKFEPNGKTQTQILMDSTYTQKGRHWVAHTIEERPKYVSCGKCGKFLSFTEVDFESIKKMGESARILYVDDAEKQRTSDNEHNEEMLKNPLIPTSQLHHIRSDTEITVDSYVYKGKYIASILDGLDENSRNHRAGKEVMGQVKICNSCLHEDSWYSIPTP